MERCCLIKARPVPPVAPRIAMCCGEGVRADEILRRDNMAVVDILMLAVPVLNLELCRDKCNARGIRGFVVLLLILL